MPQHISKGDQVKYLILIKIQYTIQKTKYWASQTTHKTKEWNEGLHQNDQLLLNDTNIIWYENRFSNTEQPSSTFICLKKSLKIRTFNQNPYIEEEQTTQWPNEKVQKDKQRSTKHTHIKLKTELHETH
jgi:hypothetical protein